MKLFLDTEFTDLTKDNKLISIALVDENEEYFYAELTDTYSLKDCSDFVKQHVMPLLRNGEDYKITSDACAVKLVEWISARGNHCIIASDNPTWDMPHLTKLIGEAWPKNLLRYQYFPIYVTDKAQEMLVEKFNYNIHNALDDALIMKKATIG